jgi:hypothetical protein
MRGGPVAGRQIEDVKALAVAETDFGARLIEQSVDVRLLGYVAIISEAQQTGFPVGETAIDRSKNRPPAKSPAQVGAPVVNDAGQAPFAR